MQKTENTACTKESPKHNFSSVWCDEKTVLCVCTYCGESRYYAKEEPMSEHGKKDAEPVGVTQ